MSNNNNKSTLMIKLAPSPRDRSFRSQTSNTISSPRGSCSLSPRSGISDAISPRSNSTTVAHNNNSVDTADNIKAVADVNMRGVNIHHREDVAMGGINKNVDVEPTITRNTSDESCIIGELPLPQVVNIIIAPLSCDTFDSCKQQHVFITCEFRP